MNRTRIFIYSYLFIYALWCKNTKGLLVATNSHKIRTINTNYLPLTRMGHPIYGEDHLFQDAHTRMGATYAYGQPIRVQDSSHATLF